MASDFEHLESQIRATNDKINARTGRPLALAITVGLALGAALIFSIVFVKALFMVFAAILIGFASYELASALRIAGRDVPRLPTVVAGLAVVPATFFWLDAGHWYVTLAGIALIAVWRIVELALPSGRASAKNLLLDLGAGALIMIYVAFMGGFSVLLTAHDGGQWWTLAFLIVVVSVDIGAYATGLTFGKHPMAPLISPKKTWEGFAGSVAAALTAGVLLSIFMLHQPWWVGVILGATMVATATTGDLAESLIKRDLGVKDISTWLPGHGGFLDRVDSSLLSAAAAYALFLIFT